MANLRRHFNFGSHKSGSVNTFGLSHGNQSNSEGIAFPDHAFSRSAFMNEVCSFLDHCSAYIQALNSFCSSSSVLAKSLVRVFHNVPVYREVAALFLGAWEDLGRVTAAASAAVKTETLMTLQDVLNKLEGESPGDESAALTESIQAVGSCLGSYLELQVQFSYSAWKALSKISKSFPQDRNSSKSAAAKSSAELATTIKKHFASLLHKLGPSTKQGSLATGVADSQQSQFYVEGTVPASSSLTSAPEGPAQPGTKALGWTHPSEELIGSTAGSTQPPVQPGQQESGLLGVLDTGSDLEDVINLLSAAPHPSPATACPKGFLREAALSVWPPPAASALGSCSGKRTWPRPTSGAHQGLSAFGVDPFMWSSLGQFDQRALCSGLPSSQSDCMSGGFWSSGERQGWSSLVSGENGSSSDESSSNNGQDSDTFLMGLNLAGSDLVASVRQRRHSSSDGPPEGLHNVLDSLSNTDGGLLDTRAVKTSTWPLKQSSSFPVNLPLSHSVGDATNDGGCLDDAAGAGFSGSVNSYFLFGHGS
ncbi:uncharacterized protein LOC142564388 [Dermacentor variabilis]|uniref:uncharacterized protein LOC142564388 n=1 Tax=Dermacentor variabilis TaxID=34621 RepID=UPI00215543DF|nr:uncharacterized protein LOC126546034 [Dermacentor andersoni]XP_050050054.1 uncharacterized protein LOC126546034 [Dermacentor andersoni]XP_054917622.1 uncharacterized protein LOC126546034 [Dermacentor andersoni]XP_054917623.1 uncharacterized protein LOC126546034 [Dermacentor andersoni]